MSGLRLFSPAPTSVGRWEALAELYISDLEARVERKAACKELLDTSARYVRSFFGHVAKEPTNRELRSWLKRHPEWKAPHTLHSAAGAVVTCIRWLVDEGRMKRCRVSKRALKLPRLRPRLALSREQVDEFLRRIKYCRGHAKSKLAMRIAIWFLSRTGCRTCEMRKLRWEEINLRNGVCVLHEHKTARATGKPRVIILPSTVLRLLRRHRQPIGLVFRNGRGRQWNKAGFARTFKRYLKQTELPHDRSPYSIRHGFCAAALDLGINDRRVAQLLGHESTKLISYYGQTAKRQVRKLRRLLDKMTLTRK